MTDIDPRDCATMAELRDVIDRLDRDLVAVLALRQRCIARAAELKPSEGLPADIPARVEDVLQKVGVSADAQGVDRELMTQIWKQLIRWSIRYEETLMAQTGRNEGN
ncbi:chorismate mutase [Qingshengfaniella alkalisoli]|uniref:chorismate mutase n=1 Tax=Qingshengfaniella alkalisoli TaxID=2599296 RepID=A0A5B8J7F1_9RHOB|nr:chorismate mutase [Qingshengfaniella alkalisoli]QDY70280.1 chorismate mutase [Qingshengfaniella alkalisoli]